ncbi:protein ALKAL-like [Carassius auratus]|uniref:Protein ALKAL-like n=2 Tax=Carassius auratus TaxID=7957 RepID=A0A6P6MAR9_CARAU|nr:protein ALKAL-like [Carassius auratus]XP_026092997.1 protein ALKAL-like [Carassius auratus]
MKKIRDCVIQDLGSAGLARTLVAGAMRALRAPVLVMGLVMIICTTAQSDASVNKVEKTFRRIMDIMRLAENSVDDASAQKKESAPKDTHRLKTETGETILKIFPRDLRNKEKVIKILTGPLYFSPKCRKYVYRLYHNTRDCTIPAYYRRCARLLVRLAESPRCQEG